MIADTVFELSPPWLDGTAPDADTVVWSQCSIARNLSDFPFPARCSEEEKRSVTRRVLEALERSDLLASGTYFDLTELAPHERRFLAERRLITHRLLCASGPRGVYVSGDQSLCVMVNGLDHLCLRALQAGQQLQEAWTRINALDDALSSVLDFAYDERLGYLSAALENLGTGLKASLLLHLPILAQSGLITAQVEHAAHSRLVLRGIRAGAAASSSDSLPEDGVSGQDTAQALYSDMKGALHSPAHDTRGDLYLLVNRGALGVSEDEFLFQLRQTAKEILEAERAARADLLETAQPALSDRVGRARGLAGGAQLIGFSEGLDLLSSLRLGIAANLLPQRQIREINALMLQSQGAHLEMMHGAPQSALELSIARAGIFRDRMAD